MIRIGPAGWSYRDWEGVVYPKQPRLDQLQYLSQFFTTIEINSTFYRPPTPKTGASWVRRTEHSPDFRFTVKLGRSFTHQREEMDPAEVRQWKEGVSPLLEAGKVGAVLVQFPWSFKNEHPSREYLVRLVEQFSEMPLVIEFRHASWGQPEVLDLLRDLGVGICGIDQPLISHSLPPHPDVTSDVGYFRLHGRNYDNWFRREAGRDERYNYLYNTEELDQQIDLVSTLKEKVEEVYVIYNNHFQGQAVVNALQLRHRLEGGLQQIPDPLLQTYPQVGRLLREG
jgi:uncharacterized protein YecE (DUF72 family)